ncbi:probable RNA-binding protein 19 [Lucilia cuprina]|uniref:probable RNA-binding protein 19 n=1 Tax=Lucilia cuprina TaxID=7375 RepID=UPI001F05B856|nr:probable RNA-binding protein 19 [Lucilia cuprina]
MSRIIVKQLPKNITEDKLRNLFGSKGTITDMQLKYTADGKFRQFCFIGYQTEDEAQQAIKFFNNTCIQTNRIRVEMCANLGSDDKPQSWSKYAKDNKKEMDLAKKIKEASLEDKKKEKAQSKLDEIIGKHKDDPEFQEFMKAHESKRSLWANDAAEAVVSENKEQQEDSDKEDQGENEQSDEEEENQNEDEEEDTKLAEKPISDLEYMKSLMVSSDSTKNSAKTKQSNIDLFTIKIHNVPYKTKRQEIIKFFKPLKPYSVRLPSKVHGFCYVGFKTEKDMTKAMLKNKSFIKGKQVFFSDFTEKNKITKAKQAGKGDAEIKAMTDKNSKWKIQESSLNNEEDISESGKIFFRNLAYTVSEDDLQKLFEQYGPVAELNLPVDTVTRQIKGFGTVTFLMPEHAVLAFNKLDGTTFHGRLLHLIPGKSSKADEEQNEENDSALTFKQKKALKLKKNAQNSVTWNTLFLGANAVAEILAKKFDTTKQRILDTDEGGSSAAVRVALGETQIVVEMKKFLEENGVHINAFDTQNAKRSKTIILAKNLPPDTSVQDLTPIFGKFGPIGRIVLPPSGVTAIIEYCDPSEARQAFKKLAYSKFKNVPLYLEWGPENTFTTSLSGEPLIAKIENEPTADETNETKENMNENQKEEAPNDDNEDDGDELPEPNTTLFLRNLNFKTEQEAVYKHFKSLGPIHTVEIAKRKDPKNPKSFSSLGYGFIQFKKSATAEYALKNMQFTNIEGNQVELKRSDRILKSAITNQGQRKKVEITKQTGTKLLVRNIPFQAKVNEVRDLFKAFGELRSIRLPKKMTPGEDCHRGFGFVDFVTKSDAKKAYDALSQSTHLYGRRIVLEWASTAEEDVDTLRKRAADDYNSSYQNDNAKRSKRAVFDTEGNVKSIANDEDEH